MAKKKTAKKSKTAESESTGRTKSKCDYCGKKKLRAWMECDPEWELPGHPDHIFRAVCEDCSPEINDRYQVSRLVFVELREALEKAGRARHEVDAAEHMAWRSFHVDQNDKELVAMARKLKVKHPWLKGKRAK